MPKPSLRGKLLEAALDRFQAQGFNGCSVQDITDAAGAPKGSFYNHFASKEALALEALDHYRQGNRVDLLTEGDAAPLARLKRHFEFLADRLDRWGFEKGCLLGNFASETADTNPSLREAAASAFDGWAATVAALLRQAQADGAIARRHDPDALARFLVYAWEGAVIGARTAKSRRPLDDFFAMTFGALLV
jgi:TetR/AcrR family transcriptional regulator, transcriptional repressor for nem operon